MSGPRRGCLDRFKGIDHLLNHLEREVNAKRRRESPDSARTGGKLGKVPPAFGRASGSPQHPEGCYGGLEAMEHPHRPLAFALECKVGLQVARPPPGRLQEDTEMDQLVPPGLSLVEEKS